MTLAVVTTVGACLVVASCGGQSGSVGDSASPTAAAGSACTAPVTSADASCAGALDLGLEVSAVGEPGAETLRVTVVLSNTGDEPVAPGIFGSELVVDGRPDPSWRLALNGAMEPEVVELPAGQTVRLTRDVRVAGLTAGSHEVVVRLGDRSTPTVRVEVG